MNTEKILAYLSELERNNDREWYHAHKEQYKAANAEFLALIQRLIFEIGKTDGNILMNNPKELTFKLVRDTRFSNDKSPYNPTFRAHIAPAGKLPIPVGYYLSIAPGGRSFLGGGLFASMFKGATTMIRDFLVLHGEEFEGIVSDEAFIAHFALKGEMLKKVPSGYDAQHPQAEYLKNKSWYLEYPVADGTLLDAERFVREAARVFALMQPFNRFLNKALQGFRMPER